MKGSLITPLGLVMVLVGCVWFAQGIGWLHGSSMTDETLWAVVGPVVAAVGAIIAGVGLTATARKRSGDG
ncbi:hypothetical protein [Nocardioides marmorisolisilvae]|uniref:Uncharacterized protein n=1 Tax=Nocardioides marmorisolisilvae TaxID=1542737 RepID=A0A3N0DUD5_9ACTN|nr:hypothetical protein [Nocardioides marmorisolisilvae]RNL79254.1 hypothetical protein EFL95_09580 [Nocardioides marmorisolisilvae]